MIALVWLSLGWALATAYFWDDLNDPWTWFLIIFCGAILGPFGVVCFMLEPPPRLKDDDTL